MTEYTKSTEQLHNEILHLRRENSELAAQLAFHRQVFREVYLALGTADELSEVVSKDNALRKLLEENEKLKNQLKIFRLSDREKEVLKFIVHGYTSKEIAKQLNISKLTVDTHRKNIQQKLDVGNIAELIKLGMQSDIA